MKLIKNQPTPEEEQPLFDLLIESYKKNNPDDLLLSLDPFLKPERVAKYLDVSPDFIYGRMASKDLKSQSLGEKLKRIRLSWIVAWLQAESERKG